MQLRWQFWTSTAILVAAILCLMQVSHGKPVSIKKNLREFPLELGGWSGEEREMDKKIKGVLGVEDSMMRVYRNEQGFPLWIYVGYYESQSKGDIIHSPKHCYPGSGWQTVQNQIEEISLSDHSGDKLRVNRFLIRKGMAQQLVLYWYQERGRINTSEYWAKLYMIFDAITRNRTDGSLVRISAPVVDSVKETLKRETEFVRLVVPLLREFIPE
ncbi:MAG: EpsI family protein [Thermodesulfobacteriota bacterium]|nr:EpsI family protein [Thermodesulfobacteriota bacterium]